jgi:hypothetical protein
MIRELNTSVPSAASVSFDFAFVFLRVSVPPW